MADAKVIGKPAAARPAINADVAPYDLMRIGHKEIHLHPYSNCI
jgi:hypothetical protein